MYHSSTHDGVGGGGGGGDYGRSTPLSPDGAGGSVVHGGAATTSQLNARLQTQYINVDDGDQSFQANATRYMAKFVGSILTPKQVLGILRVLKAISLCFIVLTILADVMYILFVDILTSEPVKMIAGGRRDIILRLYGLVLSVMALAIELDHSKLVKKFSGLKPFLARALLYFFIASLTGARPYDEQQQLASYYSAIYYQNSSSNSNNDDGGADGNDDGQGDQQDNEGNGDDGQANDDYANNQYYQVSAVEIPRSALGFQAVTSFVLCLCAIAYLICGLLCFDRFTARAFLSTQDPRITTAIPNGGNGKNSYDEYRGADPSHRKLQDDVGPYDQAHHEQMQREYENDDPFRSSSR